MLVGALAVGGVGGAAALFLAPAYKDWQAKQAEEKIIQVRVEPVKRGKLIRTVSAPGAVEPRTKVQISSRISAQIEALPFREGEAVHKGDVVVRLDDRDLQAALASAEARLRADEARLKGAQASLVNATAEWERISALFESQDVSKQDLDNAQTTLDRAKSELEAAQHAVEAAKAELDRARENLNFAIIRSPIDGVVTRLNAEVGEVVITGTMNNPGTVIMEIGDLSEMLVKAEVDESDIAPVRVGQKARVYINAYPDEQFEGVVEKIALQHRLAADRSKYFETEILLKLEEGRTLRSGLTANVEIEVEELENVILVPTQAVVDKRVDDLRDELPSLRGVDAAKTFASVVYVLRSDNTIEARPVKTGVSDLTQTAILEGLAEGEPIVVGPWSAIEKLKHGQKVRLRDDASQEQRQNTDAASDDADDSQADASPQAATS
ncbi:MAG: efflux RND transporter periplasmic adaptor subunit [Planctomycetota bacterium]|nr:MAG: efflux RND transporter periplasmic adaptor subunit [Planctomycetota bacterium]